MYPDDEILVNKKQYDCAQRVNVKNVKLLDLHKNNMVEENYIKHQTNAAKISYKKIITNQQFQITIDSPEKYIILTTIIHRELD